LTSNKFLKNGECRGLGNAVTLHGRLTLGKRVYGLEYSLLEPLDAAMVAFESVF
jgi:hypothetical protein